jgi:hypothetical protein
MTYQDPNRNAAGEYHYLGFGTRPGEQWGAGVNQYDDVISAGFKVRNQRVAAGLDEFTGLPKSTGPSGYGYAAGGSSGLYAVDESQIGAVLWGVVKWTLLWPALLLLVVCAAALAAAAANSAWRDSGPGRGLAAATARAVAPGASLAPPSAYLSPKQMAAALDLNALLRSIGSRRAESNELASAYLCQLHAECARAAEARSGALVASRAEIFLIMEAKRGYGTAAADACLLPLLTGVRLQPVSLARSGCYVAARNARSERARELSARLASSWLAQGARMVEWVADAGCFDIPAPFCRVSDAFGKAARLFEPSLPEAGLIY